MKMMCYEDDDVADEPPVFSTNLRNISFPIFVASGNRGLKYSWALMNLRLYASKSEKETHSAQP